MKYRVHHRTEYVYRDSVALCHNIAHLCPRHERLQRVHAWGLNIDPEPAIRSDRLDFFGNGVTLFAIQEPHKRLRVNAISEVEVMGPALPDEGTTLPWEQAARLLGDRPDLAHLDACQFTFDSPAIMRSGDYADYAHASFTPGRSIFDAALDLARRVKQEFEYDQGATTVSTPVAEVMRLRRGVCQDFAHLYIAALRSLGLACRYVSGYLRTIPPPGRPRLAGSDASHAWASVFIPHWGWIDLDPTNGITCGEDHVTIAWGRDYGDIAPLKGVLLGGGRHAMSVAVDVEPVG